MTFLKTMVLQVVVGLMVIGSSVYAEENSAREIISKSYHYMGTLDQYAFDATLGEDLLDEHNQWKTYKQRVKVKVDRPDKLRVDIKSEGKDRTSYLNNGVFTMVDHTFQYYGQIKTPKEIDKALDYIFDKYGINAPLAALVYKDMQKRIHFTKSKYFGTKEVGGVLCDYVAFRNSQKELHLWIKHGDEPLVRSFTLIDRTIKEKPRTTAFIEWNTNPDFQSDTFTFVPTKGLMKISVESAK